MLSQAQGRGNDSAGVGIYADPASVPAGQATVCVLGAGAAPGEIERRLLALDPLLGGARVEAAGQTTVVRAQAAPEQLEAAVREALPQATVISRGRTLTVYKGAGEPDALARDWSLSSQSGWQGVAHTRMATESAVTPGGSHPFSVGEDQCLVHNGSFSNHASIRQRLQAAGTRFDSENDTEVGARHVAQQLAQGTTVKEALADLCARFDGFYTLLVSSATSFAIVRDVIACKPAVVAQTEDWVAVASEYRYLAGLPGIDQARIYEPDPEVVYAWERSSTPALQLV
jgi:amidophosphoribosyltransferase